MLPLSESTDDIFGVIVNCMQTVKPHYKPAGEDAIMSIENSLTISTALQIKDGTGQWKSL